MTSYPPAGYISDSTRVEGEMKTAWEAIIQASKELPGGGSQNTLIITDSAITPTASAHLVDSSGSSSTNLQNAFLTNMPDGRVLTLRNVSTSRAINIIHAAGGQGQFHLARGTNFVLADPRMSITFVLVGLYWEEINRSYGPQVSSERASLGIDLPSAQITNTYNIQLTDWNRHIIAKGNGGWTLGAVDPGFNAIDGFKIYFENESASNIFFGPKASYIFKPGEGAVIMCNLGNWSVLKGIQGGGSVPTGAPPADIFNEAIVDEYIRPDRLYASRGVAQAWVLHTPSSNPPAIYNSWHTSSVVRNGAGNWTWFLAFNFSSPYWMCPTITWNSVYINGQVNVANITANAVNCVMINPSNITVDGGALAQVAFGARL